MGKRWWFKEGEGREKKEGVVGGERGGSKVKKEREKEKKRGGKSGEERVRRLG